MATPEQRVTTAQEEFFQTVLSQLYLQVQGKQTIYTTAAVIRYGEYSITIRAALFDTERTPLVRYSCNGIVLEAVNSRTVEREVKVVQLFGVLLATHSTHAEHRLAINLRLISLCATPQHGVTIARGHLGGVALDDTYAMQQAITSVQTLCYLVRSLGILLPVGVLVSRRAAYPTVPVVRELARLDINRIPFGNRLLTHGEVKCVVHTIIAHMQEALQRIVINTALGQQLTTPEHGIVAATGITRLHQFDINRQNGKRQDINVLRTSQRTEYCIAVLKLPLGLTDNLLATPEQCVIHEDSCRFRMRGWRRERQSQFVTDTITRRAYKALNCVIIITFFIEQLTTPQQRISFADGKRRTISNRRHHS